MMRVLTAKWARELAKERSLSWGLCVHDGMYCIGTIDQLREIGCTGIVPAGWCCTEWPDCDCGARDDDESNHIQADHYANQVAYRGSRLYERLAEMKGQAQWQTMYLNYEPPALLPTN